MSSIFLADSDAVDAGNMVLEKIKSLMPANNTDVTILGNCTTKQCMDVGDYFVRLYRQYGVHPSDRTAILSSVDELVCAQLVHAANNKQAMFSNIQREGLCLCVSNVVGVPGLNFINRLISWYIAFISYRVFKYALELFSPPFKLLRVSVCARTCDDNQISGDFEADGEAVVELRSRVVEAKLATMKCATWTLPNCHSRAADDSVKALLSQYERFLTDSNAVSLVDVVAAIRVACTNISDLQKQLATTNFLIWKANYCNPIEVAMIETLAAGKQVHHVTLCLPLDESFGPNLCHSRIDVSVDRCDLQEFISQRQIDTSLSRPSNNGLCSVTELYVDHIFHSYLRLLLNSRDELSLARVINVPNRDLDHHAFTDVKHEACKKSLSMYQMLTSHVMRIRLGGKGYAPSTDNPLVKHTKGLSEFADLMLKLQAIIEEETNVESSLRRIINVIKNCLLKGSKPQLRHSSIESVATRLTQQASDFAKLLGPDERSKAISHMACLSGSIADNRSLQVIRLLIDSQATRSMFDDSAVMFGDGAMSSQRTPVRFTPLLSIFRSPDEVLEEQTEKCTNKCSKQKRALSEAKTQHPTRYQSCLDWAPDNENKFFKALPRTVVDYTPSETLMSAASSSSTARRLVQSDLCYADNKENSGVELNNKTNCCIQDQPKAAGASTSTSASEKRSSHLVNSSEKAVSKAKRPAGSVSKAASGGKKSKFGKLEKGQQQLSTFFRL